MFHGEGVRSTGRYRPVAFRAAMARSSKALTTAALARTRLTPRGLHTTGT